MPVRESLGTRLARSRVSDKLACNLIGSMLFMATANQHAGLISRLFPTLRAVSITTKLSAVQTFVNKSSNNILVLISGNN
jgi:hypothetical protein